MKKKTLVTCCLNFKVPKFFETATISYNNFQLYMNENSAFTKNLNAVVVFLEKLKSFCWLN